MVPPKTVGQRIVIFTGRFGSGKTEVSVNYTLLLANSAHDARPILIDLDLVTPYFRTRELVERLAEDGVEVVTPAEVAEHLDTPAVTPQILGALQQPTRPVVLDVGGDAQGARALGQFALARGTAHADIFQTAAESGQLVPLKMGHTHQGIGVDNIGGDVCG